MATPKKAKPSVGIKGTNAQTDSGKGVTINDLRDFLKRCLAERPKLKGFTPAKNSIPAWEDLEIGLLSGYVTALNDVLQFVKGDREALAAKLRHGFLQLDASSFSKLSQRQEPHLMEEAALGELMYLVPCTQCQSAVSIFAASCGKCGTPGYIKTLLDDFQDASFLGRIAGRSDRTKSRPFGYSVDRWKNELESMGVKDREPELWQTYWRKFESSYALGWEEFQGYLRQALDDTLAVNLGSLPTGLRNAIENIKSTFGANWDQVVEHFHTAAARVIDDQRPWVDNSSEISVLGDFSTLLIELYTKGIETFRFLEPGLEGAMDYMLSAEDSRDGYFVKDLSNTYVYVNSAMGDLLKRQDIELLGKTDRDLYSEAEAQVLQEAFEKAVKGEMFIHEQSRLVGGRLKRFREVFVPKRSLEGEVVGVYGISREVPHIVTDYTPVTTADCPYPSEAMRRAMAQCRLVAPKLSSVLLLGESGSGKDHLARYIHKQSGRSGPFRPINCAAIPESLAESMLFGHERGAFTGATQQMTGFFEIANEGTAFINEIGELPLLMQAKLLTFLDDKIVQRIGGTTDVPVDVRIIAATNKDLREAVANGRFRQDLFYRLNVFSIRVPPLRERMEDLPVLTKDLITKLSTELELDSVPGMSTEA
ncbi:MAG: sigma 54-interacting transcriptional regulator, partial [Desulfomonile tiedjei]|nr:sigma 54-interacting transcriptional regulator [Desulfomonile tiedjei]